jgi:hypothetical protein
MQADVYYPSTNQSQYGNVSKVWMLDRTIAGNFVPISAKRKEEIAPNINITTDKLITARVRSDIRISELEDGKAITNIVITNIRDRNGNYIYTETAGPRIGKATLFEIATQEPFIGPFGTVEYHSLLLRRSENQGVDI